jgi:hypothetical protein
MSWLRSISVGALVLGGWLIPSVAQAGFYAGFKRYWGGVFGHVSGVILVALVVGAIAIFIVTRGKWVK